DKALSGKPEFLELLIKYGARIEFKHLHEVVYQYDSDKRIIEILLDNLLDQGLDVNYPIFFPDSDCTLVDMAISRNNFNAVEALINRGAVLTKPYGEVNMSEIKNELLNAHRTFVIHASTSEECESLSVENELDKLVLMPGEREYLLNLYKLAYSKKKENIFFRPIENWRRMYYVDEEMYAENKLRTANLVNTTWEEQQAKIAK
ncbi:MAG: hypothetical protein LBB25_02270, partial [Holosporaceae bacterium]|nr:hypothetical protein [Holosporaceae bacterium]